MSTLLSLLARQSLLMETRPSQSVSVHNSLSPPPPLYVWYVCIVVVVILVILLYSIIIIIRFIWYVCEYTYTYTFIFLGGSRVVYIVSVKIFTSCSCTDAPVVFDSKQPRWVVSIIIIIRFIDVYIYRYIFIHTSTTIYYILYINLNVCCGNKKTSLKVSISMEQRTTSTLVLLLFFLSFFLSQWLQKLLWRPF